MQRGRCVWLWFYCVHWERICVFRELIASRWQGIISLRNSFQGLEIRIESGMSDTVQQGWKLLTMVPLWYPYPCLPLFDDRIHISSDKISIQKWVILQSRMWIGSKQLSTNQSTHHLAKLANKHNFSHFVAALHSSLHCATLFVLLHRFSCDKGVLNQ